MPTATQIKKRLMANWIHFLSTNSAELSKESLSGATPPAVFVGSYGYPKVRVGPMVPPIHGDTTVFDKPELWIGKDIAEIVNYRKSLVMGVSRTDIHDKSSRYIESLQELALTRRSVESEALFENKPIPHFDEFNLELDTNLAPFGPVAPLKSFRTASYPVDQRLERSYYDKDLSAGDGIVDLYCQGIEVSSISRIVSLGMLGLEKNRKLVPTKWSISATDDVISSHLIKTIEAFPTIDSFSVHKFNHFGNYYCILLIPDELWSFEMQEAWYDKHGNVGIGTDFEDASGLDHYPTIAGAYFAGRLSVTEFLFSIRHKAAAMILREIHPEYVIPVGVWQIREGIRGALKEKAKLFDEFQDALSFACSTLSISKKEWLRNSKLYANMRNQSRITDF